jgi:hypothetical protein
MDLHHRPPELPPALLFRPVFIGSALLSYSPLVAEYGYRTHLEQLMRLLRTLCLPPAALIILELRLDLEIFLEGLG